MRSTDTRTGQEDIHKAYLQIASKMRYCFSVIARPPSRNRSGCPVSTSLEVFGDRWSLLIVRDLMVRGFRTFHDFIHSGEGIATNILADRLRNLTASGIIEAEADPLDGRRVNYRLTEKGIDLAPVMLELLIWGAKHEPTQAPCSVIAEMAKNRDAVLAETHRRWRERDYRPMLPWLGGPTPRPQPAAPTAKGSSSETIRRPRQEKQA
jgi:DNA-binding HxlR family transcriptional regulator